MKSLLLIGLLALSCPALGLEPTESPPRPEILVLRPFRRPALLVPAEPLPGRLVKVYSPRPSLLPWVERWRVSWVWIQDDASKGGR